MPQDKSRNPIFKFIYWKATQRQTCKTLQNPLFFLTLGLLFGALISISVICPTARAETVMYPTDYQDALEIVGTGTSSSVTDAMQYLAKHPSREGIHAIRIRLISEVDKVLSGSSDREVYDIIRAALIAFEVVGTNVEKELIEEKRLELDKIQFFAKTTPEAKAVQNQFLTTYLALSKKDVPRAEYPSFAQSQYDSMRENGVGSGKSLSSGFIDAVLDIRSHMEERVLEQEEAIRLLTLSTLKARMLPNIRIPETFYFMGLPGNGKDSLAEAYVDALYGFRGAYKDHLFEITATNKAELWTLLGSANGYIGSDQLGTLIRHIAEHSGGRYKIIVVNDGHKDSQVLVENREWGLSPEASVNASKPVVIFVNEAHDIPKSVKEVLLKKAMTTGRFPINNPGAHPDAVNFVEVPGIRIIFATNEGSELLEPVGANGARLGPPLSYEDLMANYNRVASDKTKLREAILKTNGDKRTAVSGENAMGTSRATLNRLPDSHIIIFKPISPNGLVKIAKNKLAEKLSELRNHPSFQFGSLDVTLSEEVYRFIQEHNYIAAENVRPIDHKIDTIIVEPLMEAILAKKIQPSLAGQKVHISLKTYTNGVSSLRFTVDRQSGPTVTFNRLIRATLAARHGGTMPASRVQTILAMADSMKANVFGIESIADRLIDRVLVEESETFGLPDTDKYARKANIMGFFGITSTGKTETARQYALARYGDEEAMKVIDFSKIKTIQDMREKILGSYNSQGEPVRSEFMEHFDSREGRPVMFVFDELSNAPKDFLVDFYEMFREKSVGGFSDGQVRRMTLTTIVLTGNLSQEIYENIPMSLPQKLREPAMQTIYNDFIRNPMAQIEMLKKHLPDALVARIGLSNAFFMRPHTQTSKRQLAILKLQKGMEDMKPILRGRVGWHMNFDKKADFVSLVELVEEEGFRPETQGASIAEYTTDEIMNPIRVRLLRERVASGSQVVVKVLPGENIKEEREIQYRTRNLRLEVPKTGQKFVVAVNARPPKNEPITPPMDLLHVAYHEAGHEILARVFFGDHKESNYLSIRPGIASINGSYIYYLGLADSIAKVETNLNRVSLIQRVAGLTAGYVAEELISIGHRSSSGKRNDMQVASDILYRAILEFGFSKKWGTRSIPQGMNIQDYLDKYLDDKERAEINREVKEWLQEAEDLARHTLLVNFERALKPLAKYLASRGEMNKVEIANFYKEHPIFVADDTGFSTHMERIRKLEEVISKSYQRALRLKMVRPEAESLRLSNPPHLEEFAHLYGRVRLMSIMNRTLPRWGNMTHGQKQEVAILLSAQLSDNRRDVRLLTSDLIPETVIDVDKLTEREVAAERANVPIPDVPLSAKRSNISSHPGLCDAIFAH